MKKVMLILAFIGMFIQNRPTKAESFVLNTTNIENIITHPISQVGSLIMIAKLIARDIVEFNKKIENLKTKKENLSVFTKDLVLKITKNYAIPILLARMIANNATSL